jgi:hypothetical protein
MPKASVESPVRELDHLATAAGFRKGAVPEVGAPAPSDLKFWASDFAFLALLSLPENDAALLDQTFLDGSAWMSLALKAEEKRGHLIDGYLLLAMPSKPDAALLAEVRRVESDTSVCRKHVLWPDADHGWTATLSAVTTLGLPSATPAGNEVTEPELPFVAKRALEERENGTSFEDVASVIEELPENEPEMNAHVD